MVSLYYFIVIVFGVLGSIGIVFKISEDGKKQLLDDMFNNDDISSDIYKKYKKQ